MISWKGAAIVLVALAAIGVYAFVSRPQGPDDSISIKSLVPCSSQNALYIKVEGSGKLLEASRTSTRDPWQLTQPVRAAGDPVRFQQLAQSIHSISAVNTIARPGPESQYGLDQPREIVTCRVTNDSSYTLSIGGESFDNSGYYALKAGGSSVYVISSVPVDEFDRDLTSPPVKQSPLPSGGPSPTPGN